MEQFIQGLGDTLSSASGSILQFLSGLVTGIPSLIIRIVIMVVASFYMTAEYRGIIEAVKKYMPPKIKKLVRDIKQYGWNILKAYLKSYFLLFLLTFTELSVGLLILRIPYAVLIALGIAVFDILPVLGTGGILIPWAVVALIMGNYPLAIGIIVLYIVITMVRNSLELGGIIGMILVPMAVVILVSMVKNGAIHIS